jgi:hypothetical protein
MAGDHGAGGIDRKSGAGDGQRGEGDELCFHDGMWLKEGVQ